MVRIPTDRAPTHPGEMLAELNWSAPERRTVGICRADPAFQLGNGRITRAIQTPGRSIRFSS